MPYSKRTDLPDNVKHVLPAHAQDIYQQAFNSAWEEYKEAKDRRGDDSREEVAHKVAWAAVKKSMRKVMTISGFLNVNAVASLFTPKGQDYLALFSSSL